MNIPKYLSTALPLLVSAAILGAGCDSQGPDVIDPSVDGNNQTAIVGISVSGGGELAQYREQSGLKSAAMYGAANGGAVIPPIDAMEESNSRLFMHHRADGSVTVADVATDKKLGQITGLPGGTDSTGLCGIAYSNLSQAWAVCYGTDSLYLLDAVNFKIARVIPLPGNPTCVGAAGTKVLIGLQHADGTGGAVVISSNSGFYPIERTFDLPSPPVAIMADPGAVALFIVDAGDTPGIYNFNSRTSDLGPSQPLPVPSLRRFMGREPNFAGISINGFLYLIGTTSIWRVTAAAPYDAVEMVQGNFSVLAVDFYTELLYATGPDAPNDLVRVLFDGTRAGNVTLPSPVRCIRFLNPSKVGQ